MARLGIDRDFLWEFGKFEQATHAGIHLEKIAGVRDPRLRSIRIDQSWRGIVLAPESGDSYTLLTVLPHDDAYDWACRRRISVNRATGVIEVRDVAAIEERLPNWPRTPRRPRPDCSTAWAKRTLPGWAFSEAIVGASRATVDPDRDFSHGVAITSSFHPDADTHVEPVRYGPGSNAMGLLQTLATDGASVIPRWRQFLRIAGRHPVTAVRLLSVRRWSERTMILLVM